jgi:O-antigen ligase
VLLILGGVLGVLFAAGVISLFVRWEREGNEQLIPLVLLGLLVLDGSIYADPNMVPRGLFHPGSGATQLRLPEIYITLALIARLIAKGRPTRIGLPAGLWLAFGGWLFVGMLEGKLYYNPFSQDIYEAKDILYIVGAYALAAGVPVRKYFERGDLYKLGALSVVCATVLDLMQIGGVTVNTTLPLLPLQGFGAVGAETAALFLAIGLACFLTRLASGPVKFRHVLALVPVVVSVVLANQRAVIVNLVVEVLVVLVAVLVARRRGMPRRFHARSGHVLLMLLALVAIGMAVVVVPAAVDRQAPKIPFASTYDSLFHNEGKAESAQDRLNLASEAEALIPKHFFIGYGLGIQFSYYEAGTRTVQPIAYAHNIVLDLWLRLGLVGLTIFVLAMGESILGGLRAWRRHTDPRVAALALALVAVLAGLMATGFLEPLIDEYRFATLLGVSLGMLRACVTSLESRSRSLVWQAEAVSSVPPAGRSRWA